MTEVHSNYWVAYIPDLLELAYFEAPFAAISWKKQSLVLRTDMIDRRVTGDQTNDPASFRVHVDDVWYRQWCQQVLDTVPNTLFYIHILSKLKATLLWFEIYLLRASTWIIDENSSWIDNIPNGEHILPQICYFLWYLGREYHTIERWLKYRSWPTKFYIWTNVSDPTMVYCM